MSTLFVSIRFIERRLRGCIDLSKRRHSSAWLYGVDDRLDFYERHAFVTLNQFARGDYKLGVHYTLCGSVEPNQITTVHCIRGVIQTF